MTSVDRDLSGDVLGFDLDAEMRTAREELMAGPARIARPSSRRAPCGSPWSGSAQARTSGRIRRTLRSPFTSWKARSSSKRGAIYSA